MENENIKNELNIINVGGHRVKTSSTGDATFKVRGKLKKFKSFDLRPPYNFIEAMNKVKSSSPSNWRCILKIARTEFFPRRASRGSDWTGQK